MTIQPRNSECNPAFVPNRARTRNRNSLRQDVLDTFEEITNSRRYVEYFTEYGPYEFMWPDEEFRDQIFWYLCESDTRKSDYAAERLLRKLMFRFRGASFRRNRSLGIKFDGYSWVWKTNAEMEKLTCLSTDQIRRAGRFLEERGLIVRFTHHNLGYVPHYRPTDDLVCLCHYLCYLYDGPERRADDIGRAQEGLEPNARTLAAIGRRVRSHHMDVVRALVNRFASNDDPDRIDAFREEFCELWGVAAGGVDPRTC